MAMSNCRECGREVSTLAKSCPGCGVPNPTKITKSIKTKVKSKRVSKSSLSSKSKNNLIKDFWDGKISLGKSFWLGGFVVLAIAGLPLVYATLNIDNISDGAATLFIIYFFLYACLNIFIYIGIWKSASIYIQNKKKNKQTSFWGYVTKVLIIIGAIRGIAELFQAFHG